MSRKIVVNVTDEHGGLWPRVMKCFVCRGSRFPQVGERVVIEAQDGEVLKVLSVDAVDKAAREYSVRIW